MSLKNKTKYEIIIEIKHRKFSKRFHQPENSGRIAGHLEVFRTPNDPTPYRTKNIVIAKDSQFAIPWDGDIYVARINFFVISGGLTEVLGSCFLQEISNQPDGVEFVCNILQKNNLKVGKARLIKYTQKVATANGEVPKIPSSQTTHDIEEIVRRKNLPGFQFRRLSRPVNWDRVKYINLER